MDSKQGNVASALRRRDVLRGGAALGARRVPAAWRAWRAPGRPALPTVVNSIRSLSNPYHATWNKGGAAFAKSVGADYVTLVTEGNSEKGVADIKAILSKTGGNCVINVDPNDSPDARPIVEACKQAGAYVVTQWNKPADLHPWDNNPNYVAHISFSGVPYGKAMAETLIKAMGGKGGIVALGGIESNTPAIERKKGLDAALAANPGVQAARFPGRQLVGQRGAREGQRLADQVSATRSAASGPPTTTWRSRPSRRCAPTAGPARCRSPASTAHSSPSRRSRRARWPAPSPGIPIWQGSMGLAIGYAAKTGKFDPAKEPKEHREFYGKGVIVTSANANEYLRGQRQERAEARLERPLGPGDRPDRLRLEADDGPAGDAPVADRRRSHCTSARSVAARLRLVPIRLRAEAT